MKNSRQNVILEIITGRDIETQNQLMDVLREKGISSTQATLSRDVKELRLVKELAPSGKYRYVAAARSDIIKNNQRLNTIFRECVISYAPAQNLIILKTLPGMAMAACAALDAMEIPNLIGCIAGDDTAFLAMKDNETAGELCREIGAML